MTTGITFHLVLPNLNCETLTERSQSAFFIIMPNQFGEIQ